MNKDTIKPLLDEIGKLDIWELIKPILNKIYQQL